jgi:sulfite reductase (NADPH) flavoprotein alpha-component
VQAVPEVDKTDQPALNRCVSSGPLILFATASGNAEQLAHAAADALRADGHTPRVSNVADFPAAGLRAQGVVLLIVSTWGEGAPPPDAEEFCAALAAGTPGELAGVRYAVLALGSSMYAEFCACGRRIDADLARLGAVALVPRVECDTKYKADFERWLAAVRTAVEKSA